MAEQDDNLVRLVAGAMWLGDRPVGPDQHRPLDPVALAERTGHLVTGHHRRRQRAQLGQVRGQIRVGVADQTPARAVRPRRIGPDRGGQPGQYRSALAGLLGRDQPVECGADRDVTPDHLGQPEHRHAAVAFPRVALGRRDVRHEIRTRGPVRASVVAGDDAPRDAGQRRRSANRAGGPWPVRSPPRAGAMPEMTATRSSISYRYLSAMYSTLRLPLPPPCASSYVSLLLASPLSDLYTRFQRPLRSPLQNAGQTPLPVSLNTLLRKYAFGRDNPFKEIARKHMDEDPNYWEKRPMTDEMVQYAR